MRLVAAAVLSCLLVAAGLGPATASNNHDGESGGNSGRHNRLVDDGESPVSTVPVSGAKILTKGKGAKDGISVSLPGTPISPQEVDKQGVPKELIHGDDSPIASTTLTDASVTAYATDYGSQSIINITGKSAPHEFRFNLDLPDGASTELNSDGSVRIVDQTGKAIGLVQVPWAYDSNGVKVSTSFALIGAELVQRVSHDTRVAYPVKADPSIQWIPWPVLALWGAEIKAFSSISVALAAGGAWAGCTFSRLSGVFAKIVNQICTLVGIAGVKGVVDAVASVWGPSSINNGTCYGVPLYNPRGWLSVMPAWDCW